MLRCRYHVTVATATTKIKTSQSRFYFWRGCRKLSQSRFVGDNDPERSLCCRLSQSHNLFFLAGVAFSKKCAERTLSYLCTHKYRITSNSLVAWSRLSAAPGSHVFFL